MYLSTPPNGSDHAVGALAWWCCTAKLFQNLLHVRVQVVSLLRERSTEPLIKGWLLALLLSLIHPVKGLNPRTQQVSKEDKQ